MGRTILVADDDPLVRRLIATTLESVAGFEVLEAADGEQAVRLARRHRPAIVFLDLHMPRLDGIGACRRIRRGEGAAATTIIMLTATPARQLAREADAAGADRVLSKPFSPLGLLRLVDRVGAAQG